MSQYSRATVSIEAGRIDRVSVVSLAEDADRCLLTIVASDARVVIETGVDDLWKIATACRDAVKRREEERRMDDLAAEVDTVPTGRDFANDLLRKLARA